MHDISLYDVVIAGAGAGPVGLFLACELRLSNVSVLILEQAEHPDSPLKRLPFGMRGLSFPSIEAFYRRGLLDAVAAPQVQQDPAAATAHWTQQSRQAGGHFAGIQFYRDRLNCEQWQDRQTGLPDTSMASSMAHLESILTARALEMGVEIRRGVALQDVGQDAHEVLIHTSAGSVQAVMAGAALCARPVDFSSAAPSRSSPVIRHRLNWPIPSNFLSAATIPLAVCTPISLQACWHWWISMAAFVIAPALSNWRTCSQCCGACPVSMLR
jgi:hypothetical protein